MSGGRKLVKGSAEAKAYMASIRNKRGKGASGAGFFDDVMSGISKVGQVAGQVLPVASQGLDLYNKFNKGKGMSGGGQSGGRRGNGAGVYGMPELLGRTTQVLEGRGGTDGFPSGFKDNKPLSMAGGRRGRGMSGGAVPLKSQLVGILDDRTLGNGQSGGGMSGGDFWSDFGDGFMSVIKPVSQVVGAIAPFLGAGQSGGRHKLKLKPEMYGTSMTGAGESGGKRPHLVKGSAEAKAYMASIRNKKGKGMSGGGIMEPAVSAEVGQPRYSYGQMADTAGKSNVGSGGGQSGGRRGRGMSGGALSYEGNMAMADAMGDIFAGMGNSGGRQVGCGYSGGNVASELSLSSAALPLAEAFLGGRRPQDVPRDEKLMLMKKALADYAMMKQFKKHLNARQGGGKLTITHGAGMSGGDGLANDDMDSLVDRDFTGAGMSGGDFWGDLGGVAQNLLPLLPMLL